MLPNRTLNKVIHRLAYGLLLAMLLPVAVAGQALSRAELQQIKQQLKDRPADTTQVRLLLAVSAHATSHAKRSTARDSALQFAKAALALSTRIGYDSGVYNAYLKEIALWVSVYSLALEQKQDASKALENKQAVQDKLINFMQKNGSPEQLGETYAAIASLYKKLTSDYAETLLLYDSAAAYFRRSGNALRESHMLYNVGYHYNQLGELKTALPIYHRSIALAEPTGGRHLYRVYGILGHNYSLLGGYNIALKYELKALALAEAAQDTTEDAGALHLFLGMTYEKLKDYAAAREHYEKGYLIDRHDVALHPNDFFSLAVNLAKMMTMINPQEAIDFLTRFKKEYQHVIKPYNGNAVTIRFMQAYARLHDYTTAQKYCDELIAAAATARRPNLPEYLAISQFLVLSKQYKAAEKYLAVAERVSKEQKRIPNLPNIYLYWFKIDSAKGDFPAAIRMLKLHKAYSDSALNDVKTKEIALLNIEYETAKKEHSIALLTKDSALGRQQLAQSTFQKNATLAGLAVTILILGLLYNQYRIKKKSNTELTRQQHEIQTTNSLLQKTILEKEWLLKEVHHRVKNNLQTVVSLLGTQSYLLQNTEAAAAIQDSQNRVHAMSLIHQKLYQTEHRTSVNMAGYLGELTEYLRDSFPTGRMIQFQLYIDAIELDVSQAIPIGLIINESVTNTIKYAFPAEQKENCRVVIAMHQDASRNVLLTITDNGRGLPPDFDSSGNYLGMGLRLIHGLTSELDGRCKVSNNDIGVSIEITFNATALMD